MSTNTLNIENHNTRCCGTSRFYICNYQILLYDKFTLYTLTNPTHHPHSISQMCKRKPLKLMLKSHEVTLSPQFKEQLISQDNKDFLTAQQGEYFTKRELDK